MISTLRFEGCKKKQAMNDDKSTSQVAASCGDGRGRQLPRAAAYKRGTLGCGPVQSVHGTRQSHCLHVTARCVYKSHGNV